MTNTFDFENMPSIPYKPLAETAKKIACEGAVLLKNDNNVLPVSKSETISVFGRTQIDYIKSGTGSGGLVHCEYVINILDGIRENKKLKINEDLVEIYTDVDGVYSEDPNKNVKAIKYDKISYDKMLYMAQNRS